MRRHAKATSAASTSGRGLGLAEIRRALAVRDASDGTEGSGAPSIKPTVRVGIALMSVVLLVVLAPASASASLSRDTVGASPITGGGIGLAGFKNAGAVVIDEATGNVFLNDGRSNSGEVANAIEIMNSEGGHPVGVASPYRITGIHFDNEPTGIAIDKSSPPSTSFGALYSTDTHGSPNSIKKFVRNPATELYEPAGELLAGPGEETIDEPLGVAVDNKGNVYVANFYPADIIKFSPTGAELSRFSVTSTVEYPSSLAFDTAGDLFVESYGNGSVYEYPANGSGEIEPAVHTKVLSSGATGLAVDTATNRLMISVGNHVDEYDIASLKKLGEFGAGIFSNGAGRLAVNSATDRVYVSDSNSFANGGKIVIFGAPVVIPTVETGEAEEVEIGKATLAGSVNPENVAVTECKFEYGTSLSYEEEVPCEGAIPTDGSDHTVTAKLTGLQGETQYHFRISAKNANGTHAGGDATFTTPASVLIGEATNVSGTKATLHGTDFPANVPVLECKFEYGRFFEFEKSVPCAQVIPTDNGEHEVSAVATHLLPNGAFQAFRLSVRNAEGTFHSTAGFVTTPNTTKTLPASNKSVTTVKLNGSVNPDGVPLTECRFEYGPTSSYGTVVPCSPAAGSIPGDSNTHNVSASLTGLTPSGTYHYRLVTATVDNTEQSGATVGEDVIFHTLGPLLEKVKVSFPSMTDESATVKAEVNPQGKGTAYRFEYVTQAQYEQSGFAGAGMVPSSVVGVGHGEDNVPISQLISGLTPATHYHVRIVITSLDGTITGPDLAFATFPRPSLPASSSCPDNEQFRTEASAGLPDCRAYEQASPTDKNGTDIGGDLWTTAVSPSGDAVTEEVASGIPGGTGTTEFPTFVARRGATNWATKGTLAPPQFGENGGMEAFTPDLKLFFNGATKVGINDESTEVIHNVANDTFQEVYPRSVGFGGLTFRYRGASADDSKIFFEGEGEPLPVTSGPAPANNQRNLYVYEPETEALSLVDVLPASEGGQAASEGAFFGAQSYYWVEARHAVSADGDKAIFSTPGAYSSSAIPALYMRKGIDGGSPETVKISESQRSVPDPKGLQPAEFWAATPDGSEAFFTSPEELTNDANTGPTPPIGLGQADISDGGNAEPNFISGHPAADVAVDAGHVYWTEPGENAIGRAGIGGTNVEPNFITGANNPRGVVADGSHIYWTNSGDGTIGRADIGGSNVNQSCVTGAHDPLSIAIDATYIYWGNSSGNQSVGRATLACGSVNQEFAVGFGGERTMPGLAVDANKVYWMDNGEGNSRISCANIADGSGFEPNCHGLFLGSVGGGGVEVDGSHIYWTQTNEETGGPGSIGRANVTDGSAVEPKFIKGLDHPTGALAISASKVYWSTNPPLGHAPGDDLYVYNAESEELTDLTVDNGDVNGADVQGVVGVSNDGSRVYFAANGDLDGGGPATAGDCNLTGFKNWSGECSLYLWDEGEITFVAPMDANEIPSGSADWSNWQRNEGPGINGPNFTRIPSGMVSADGSSVVFSTKQQLTSYDNEGVHEFYRYHVGDPGPVCITCNPTDAPAGGQPLTESASVFSGGSREPFIPRNLSASGNQFFFDTTEKLVPEDTNGDVECPQSGGFSMQGPVCQDVYEWEADGAGSCHAEGGQSGCFYLLSTGKEAAPAFFAGASESGDDAFIFTHAPLVPQDQDSLMDIYDASVDGGLAAQHPVTPPHCEGEGCREAVTPTPPANGAGTAVFEGPENPAINRKKPKKPHKKHHKKHHHRKANKTRGTSR